MEVLPTQVRYSDEEKRLAKTLKVAFGSSERARQQLMYMWGSQSGDGADAIFEKPSQVPSRESIDNWAADPRIPIDEDFLDLYRNELRFLALTSAGRVAAKAEDVLIKALEADVPNSLDAKNFSTVWSAAIDRLSPRGVAAGESGGGSMVVNIVTFAPAQVQAPRAHEMPAIEQAAPIEVHVVEPEPIGIEV